MPLYFAYGANMDVAAMALRCPRSTPVGPGRLANHRFFIMHEGYASVRPEAEATVHGLLWSLALADVPALDRYEEIGDGLYTKVVQPVIRPGGFRRALIYKGSGRETGSPKPGYMEAVLVAAESLDLPALYRDELRRWLPRGASKPRPGHKLPGSIS